MKNILQLFFLLVITVLNAQSGKVTYTIQQFATESLDAENERTIKLAEEMELMEFTLVYNTKGSYFKKEQNIPRHSTYFARIAAILSGSEQDSYQYLNPRSSLQNVTVSGETYQVDYGYRMKDWKLTEDSKKIDNYLCYKAIVTEYNERADQYYDVIAWYTPEIPAPFGPIGYGGLPGLILELNYRTNLFIVDKIVLNPRGGIVLPKIEEGKRIDTKELVQVYHRGRKVTPD